MFLVRKPAPAVTPQEKRIELLREFYLGNMEYAVKFDHKDMVKREYYLRRIISGGWLGVGCVGLGFLNLRVFGSIYPELNRFKWAIIGSYTAFGTIFMVKNYFNVKLESQEYLREKYLSDQPSGSSSSSPRPK